jgi:hypothetical protein
MGAATERRFTIADGLILVAATAAGLALMRSAFGPFTIDAVLRKVGDLNRPPEQLMDGAAGLVIVFVMPCLAAWTLAVALLVLRRPRPGLFRLTRRPGAMACFAAGVATPAALVAHLVVMRSRVANLGSVVEAVVMSWTLAATALVSCWLTMVVSGRWRAEPTWLDRLGRALGFAWLAVYPLLLWIVIREFER